jgi:hypothetical protein
MATLAIACDYTIHLVIHLMIPAVVGLMRPGRARTRRVADGDATAGSAGPTDAATGDIAMATKTKKTGGTKKNAAKAKAPKAAKPEADAKPKRTSALDAAAQVLKDAGEPMQVRAMVEAMKTKGLWSSGAPTPHATLYSAIIREIKNRKGESRFKKTDRGHFALNA